MWIKKSKEEIKKETKKKSFIENAILFAFLVLVFQIIADKSGFTKFGDIDVLTWNEIIRKLPIYLLISGGAFIVAFLFQAGKGTHSGSVETTYICDKCNNKKLDDGKYNCECGGEFIHINLMKWVEDDENKEEELS